MCAFCTQNIAKSPGYILATDFLWLHFSSSTQSKSLIGVYAYRRMCLTCLHTMKAPTTRSTTPPKASVVCVETGCTLPLTTGCGSGCDCASTVASACNPCSHQHIQAINVRNTGLGSREPITGPPINSGLPRVHHLPLL